MRWPLAAVARLGWSRGCLPGRGHRRAGGDGCRVCTRSGGGGGRVLARGVVGRRAVVGPVGAARARVGDGGDGGGWTRVAGRGRLPSGRGAGGRDTGDWDAGSGGDRPRRVAWRGVAWVNS